jgi:hypothetical protein
MMVIGDGYYPTVHDHKWQPGRRLIGIEIDNYSRQSAVHGPAPYPYSVRGFNFWYSADQVDPNHMPQKIPLAGDWYATREKKVIDDAHSVKTSDPIIGVDLRFDDVKGGILYQIHFITRSVSNICYTLLSMLLTVIVFLLLLTLHRESVSVVQIFEVI